MAAILFALHVTLCVWGVRYAREAKHHEDGFALFLWACVLFFLPLVGLLILLLWPPAKPKQTGVPNAS